MEDHTPGLAEAVAEGDALGLTEDEGVADADARGDALVLALGVATGFLLNTPVAFPGIT